MENEFFTPKRERRHNLYFVRIAFVAFDIWRSKDTKCPTPLDIALVRWILRWAPLLDMMLAGVLHAQECIYLLPGMSRLLMTTDQHSFSGPHNDVVAITPENFPPSAYDSNPGARSPAPRR